MTISGVEICSVCPKRNECKSLCSKAETLVSSGYRLIEMEYKEIPFSDRLLEKIANQRDSGNEEKTYKEEIKDEIEKMKLQETVFNIIDSNLTQSLKEVLIAHCLLGLTQEDIAKILEKSQPLISKRKRIAIEKIKEIYGRYKGDK